MFLINYKVSVKVGVFAVILMIISCDSRKTKDEEGYGSSRRGGERQGLRVSERSEERHTNRNSSSEESTKKNAARTFTASDGPALIDAASFADALETGRAMIENDAIPPSELMAFFGSLNDVAKSEKLRGELIEYYVAKDLDQALILAEMVPPGRLSSRVYAQIAKMAEPTRLLDVVEAAKKNGLPEVLRTTKVEIASRMLELNEAELLAIKSDSRALDFSGALEQRRASLDYEKRGLREADFVSQGSLAYKSEILRVATIDNPETTAKWVKDNLELVEPYLTKRQELIGYLVNGYLAKSPSAAMDWAAALASGKVSAQAVRTGIDSWLQIDSVAASQWVAAQPAGQARDVSALAIAQHLQKTGDLSNAKLWAQSITSEPYAKVARTIIKKN